MTNFLNFGPELDAIFADAQKILQQQTGQITSEASFGTKVLAALGALARALDDQTGLIKDDFADLSEQLTADVAALSSQLEQILAWTAAPSAGAFNPPPDLVNQQTMEVTVSVLQLEVGQTAVGKLTFDEITPPTDGAVASDSAAVTISLDATDHVTWTCSAVSVTAANTPANVTYTGTSVAPDAGPAVVPPMLVTVVPVPVAEHGDFDPTHATISGP